MKHARKDYDRIQDPDGKIPDDEPVFLLRGQDVYAPTALRVWAARVRGNSPQGVSAIADSAEAQADEMLRWQGKHGFKMPDAPEDAL